MERTFSRVVVLPSARSRSGVMRARTVMDAARVHLTFSEKTEQLARTCGREAKTFARRGCSA
jgi:hypothetical protein